MENKQITDADKRRLKLAMMASSSNWERFADLEGQCDSPEVGERIHRHIISLYHMAEAKAGMI